MTARLGAPHVPTIARLVVITAEVPIRAPVRGRRGHPVVTGAPVAVVLPVLALTVIVVRVRVFLPVLALTVIVVRVRVVRRVAVVRPARALTVIVVRVRVVRR